jgi:hypothetical protein
MKKMIIIFILDCTDYTATTWLVGGDPLHPADAPAVVAKESTPRHEFELPRIMSRR